MIIQCDKCNTKFRLDDSRVTGHGVKVRCTKCQNVFIVTPPLPIEEVQVEEDFGTQPAARNPKKPEPAPSPERTGPSPTETKERSGPDLNLKFDFERPEDGEAPETGAKNSFGEDEGEQDGDTSGGEEFKFTPEDGTDGDREEKTEDEDNFEFKPAPPKGDSLGDLDFNFEDIAKDPAEEKKTSSPADEWGLGEDDGSEADLSDSEAPAPQEPEKTAGIGAGYTRSGRPAPDPEAEKPMTDRFEKVLSETLSSDEDPDLPDIDEEEIKKYMVPPQKNRKGLIIAVLIFILGGAAIYYTGIVDSIARKLTPASTSVQKVVEIENINGYYIENKSFGRFFVIDAKIKNITDTPQGVKSVAGILYNDKGEKIASRSVSPGRIVTTDDLKNLSKDDLLKQFKDASGGTLPAKAVVPVMVLFTEVPAEMVEYGLDIVR